MSNNVLRLPATKVWMTLMAVTLLSWWLAEHQATPARIAASAVIMIAAFKVRMVFIYFMELKWQPKPWRLVYEIWTLVITVAILGGYWLTEVL